MTISYSNVFLKTVPLNGLAGPAGVWPATFTGANKTDRNATWRAKVNYAVVLTFSLTCSYSLLHDLVLVGLTSIYGLPLQ